MQIKAILAMSASLAVAPLATAVGSARVVNNCDGEVSLWSVGSQVDGPWHLKADGGSYSETLKYDDQTGGRTIKITHERDGLYTGDPQLSYAYTLDGAQIWYDLNSVFGEPFDGDRLVVKSAKTSCPAIVWDDGTNPGGSQVKTCTSAEDVTLTLCA